MPLRLSCLGVLIYAMFLPLALYPPPVLSTAIEDFQALKAVIDNATCAISRPVSGINGTGQDPVLEPVPEFVGAAELITGITTLVLRTKYYLDTNKDAWLPIVNGSAPPPLDDPYIDYVNTIPKFSHALTALGRSWHVELNHPVSAALDALQASMHQFSAALLQNGLIHMNSTIRTIRATTSLGDAQQAWSKILNLPGNVPGVEGSATIRSRSRIRALYNTSIYPKPSDSRFIHNGPRCNGQMRESYPEQESFGSRPFQSRLPRQMTEPQNARLELEEILKEGRSGPGLEEDRREPRRRQGLDEDRRERRESARRADGRPPYPPRLKEARLKEAPRHDSEYEKLDRRIYKPNTMPGPYRHPGRPIAVDRVHHGSKRPPSPPDERHVHFA